VSLKSNKISTPISSRARKPVKYNNDSDDDVDDFGTSKRKSTTTAKESDDDDLEVEVVASKLPAVIREIKKKIGDVVSKKNTHVGKGKVEEKEKTKKKIIVDSESEVESLRSDDNDSDFELDNKKKKTLVRSTPKRKAKTTFFCF
jgi:hypothetical protein